MAEAKREVKNPIQYFNGMRELELRTASDVLNYCRNVQMMARTLFAEFELAHEELRGALASMNPNDFDMNQAQLSAAARKTARHLHKMASHSEALGVEAVRLPNDLMKNFGMDASARKKGPKKFDPTS